MISLRRPVYRTVAASVSLAGFPHVSQPFVVTWRIGPNQETKEGDHDDQILGLASGLVDRRRILYIRALAAAQRLEQRPHTPRYSLN